MKASGRTLYPVQKIEAGKERIQALLKHNKTLQENCYLIENISIEEFNGILNRAQYLAEDGFSAAEVQELGIMLVNAVKEK